MKLMISEVLQKAHNAKTKAQKIAILKENNTPALRMVFVANFDETLVPRVPLGEVPYRPNDAPKGTEHTLLEKEANKLYYYFKGGADNVSNMKIESMFIQLLEGLHESEADVVVKAINKNLHKRYRITHAVVKDAFPSIKWGNRGR